MKEFWISSGKKKGTVSVDLGLVREAPEWAREVAGQTLRWLELQKHYTVEAIDDHLDSRKR